MNFTALDDFLQLEVNGALLGQLWVVEPKRLHACTGQLVLHRLHSRTGVAKLVKAFQPPLDPLTDLLRAPLLLS